MLIGSPWTISNYQFLSLNKSQIKDHILNSCLFNTVKEIMTASSNSFHVKEGGCLNCKFKNPKRPQRHDEKEILFPIYIGLCIFIHSMKDLNHFSQIFFCLNNQLMMHHPLHCDLFNKSAFCCTILAVKYWTKSNENTGKRSLFCVKSYKDIFSPCVRGLSANNFPVKSK